MRHIAIIFLLYSYIYSPPLQLLPFGLIKLILPIAYFFFCFSKKHRKALGLFKIELIILVLILFYSTLISLLSFNLEFPFVYQNIGLLLEAFPLAVFLVVFIIGNRDVNINGLLYNVFAVGLIASCISVYLMLNPDLNYRMNNQILRTSSWLQGVEFRGFGFASQLSFGYGITQGIVCAIGLYFVSRNKYLIKQLFLVIAVIVALISVFVNARIGIVPIFIILVYLLIIKRSVKLMIFIFIVAFTMTKINYESDIVDSRTVKYAFEFFTETSSSIDGNNDKTTYDILLDMMIFPTNVKDIIFGSGQSLFGNINNGSDVGYILQLWFGGLIYLSLLLYLVFYMARKLYKNNSNHWFLYIFLVSILVCNVKGYFISNNPAFRVLILIYVGLAYVNKIGLNFRQKSHE